MKFDRRSFLKAVGVAPAAKALGLERYCFERKQLLAPEAEKQAPYTPTFERDLAIEGVWLGAYVFSIRLHNNPTMIDFTTLKSTEPEFLGLDDYILDIELCPCEEMKKIDWGKRRHAICLVHQGFGVAFKADLTIHEIEGDLIDGAPLVVTLQYHVVGSVTEIAHEEAISRIAAYRKALEAGYMSVNEVREAENLGIIPKVKKLIRGRLE